MGTPAWLLLSLCPRLCPFLAPGATIGASTVGMCTRLRKVDMLGHRSPEWLQRERPDPSPRSPWSPFPRPPVSQRAVWFQALISPSDVTGISLWKREGSWKGFLGQLGPPLPNSLKQELLGGVDRARCR